MLNITFHAIEFIQMESITYEEYLQHRRSGIGGCDVPAICGLSNGEHPYKIYPEKIGETHESSLVKATKWGTRLEPLSTDKIAIKC